MVLKMKPLADPERRRERRERVESHFRRTVLADEPHVKMTIIGGALSFLMACRRGPRLGEIEEAVPMNALRSTDQQLGRASDAPLLHLFGPEGRNADLSHPDRQRRHGADLRDLCRPFIDAPQIP